jgi:UDP-N-acetylmuramoylalanine--D-glutamate ligase
MKRALVIGLGISGRAAAELLLSRGVSVVGIDGKKETVESHPDVVRLKEKGLVAQLDTVPLDLQSFDEVVVSPGIPQTHLVYAQCLASGIPITGEAELAFKEVKQPCIGITGTNGKTTVTLLVEHILNVAGKVAKALGNVGDPLTAYFLTPPKEEIIVAELSSYQLETMETAVFDAGVILNITPDHLDRYPDMEAYAAAKWRLNRCMKSEAPLYVHEQVMKEFGSYAGACVYTYGRESSSTYWTDKKAIWNGEKIETILPLHYKNLGMHESENALAAWLMCKPFGVSSEIFLKALNSFNKPAHRIEYVLSLNGVDYFDDSKGTNIDAVIQAVGAMNGPVVLIAGGVDKGASYAPWKELFRNKVKKIVAIGQASQKISQELRPDFDVELAVSLEQAVERAAAVALEGDVVLLSPGCSSFDMFRDYADRGEKFKRHVHHLQERRKQ